MELAIMIRGLVCQTSRKKRGRLRRASSLSRSVSGSVPGAGCPLGAGPLLPGGLVPADDFLPDEFLNERSSEAITEGNKIAMDMLQTPLRII